MVLRSTPKRTLPASGPGEPAAPRRVLVVDDDPAIQHVLGEALRDAGLAVRAAPDGEAALRAARDWRPHVILCDLIMPRMDGYTFLERYRDAPEPRAPVLLMTAAGVAKESLEQELGSDAVIAKPFNLAHLVERVRRMAPRPREH